MKWLKKIFKKREWLEIKVPEGEEAEDKEDEEKKKEEE